MALIILLRRRFGLLPDRRSVLHPFIWTRNNHTLFAHGWFVSSTNKPAKDPIHAGFIGDCAGLYVRFSVERSFQTSR